MNFETFKQMLNYFPVSERVPMVITNMTRNHYPFIETIKEWRKIEPVHVVMVNDVDGITDISQIAGAMANDKVPSTYIFDFSGITNVEENVKNFMKFALCRNFNGHCVPDNAKIIIYTNNGNDELFDGIDDYWICHGWFCRLV